jgi:hypothetical protein
MLQLVGRIDKLGVQLTKNSHNISKPPSSDRRQVFEIPKIISIHMTEYKAKIKDCHHCGVDNKADFPEGFTRNAPYVNYLK